MITPFQFRAARAFIGFGQEDVAKAIGSSKSTLADIESGVREPKQSTADNLQKFFELKGVEFTQDGGIRPARNIVHIYEGADCYMRMLNDVHQTVGKGGEFLKSAADERRSSAAVIEKTRALRADGIKMRALVRHGDTHLMGDISEYRWMDEQLFADGDVKVIYGDRVGYLASWLDVPRAIILQDKKIADEARRQFNYAWDRSEVPTESTAPEKF